MLNFLWTSVSVILTSLIISLRCEDGNEALHFIRNIRGIIDGAMNKKLNYPPLIYPTATACSATYEKENAFNKQNSLSKNSLFVRNTYEGSQTSKDVDYLICENTSKLSVVYHTKDVEFIFGFEIYYDKSQYGDKGFLESNRGDYDFITNTHAYTNYMKALLPYIPVLSHVSLIPVVSRFLQTPLYLDDEHKKEMGFLWLDSFWMKFDFQAQRASYAIYGLTVTTRGRRECADYDLGKEFFNGFEMKNLYLMENQKSMLTSVKFPKSESDDNYGQMACESENQCFAKWSLVPAELFHQLETEPTSCSDLLTVPVWKSTIYDLLTKLDNFLFALSIVIGHPVGNLTIYSGVNGVLKLPADSFIRSTKPITLAGKNIKVPDIIYKLIHYTTKSCRALRNIDNRNDKSKATSKEPADNDDKNDELKSSKSEPSNENKKLKDSKSKPEDNDGKTDELKTEVCSFAESAIIVIIHNNPNFDPEEDRICKDMCTTLGWEIIKQKKLSDKEIIESRFIYCCQANDNNVKKKLNINNTLSDDPKFHYSSAKFSLKGVPMYNTDTKVFDLNDVHDFVVEAYENLFEGAKHEDIKSNEWDTFMKNYHVKMAYLSIEAPKNDGVEPDNTDEELKGKKEKDESSLDDADSGLEK